MLSPHASPHDCCQPVVGVFLAALCLLVSSAPTSLAQEVRYEEKDGIRYQVTRRVTRRQVPTTEVREQQQTVYRPSVTTKTVDSQQMYSVPVTQYQMVSTLHGRWNPLVTPYWTHEMKPVTTWHQQMATVKVPVVSSAWVPETRTVRMPVTTMRSAEEVTETRVALGAVSGSQGGRLAAAPSVSDRGRTQVARGPSATLAARPGYSGKTRTAQRSNRVGGVALESDPPRRATGWQRPASSRY